MAINFSTKDFLENIIDITAIKSKILLTENDISRLYSNHPELEPIVYLINEPEHIIRVHYDEVDSIILELRKSIGNIPDTRDSTSIMMDGLRDIINSDPESSGKVLDAVKELMSDESFYSPDKLIQASEKYDVSVDKIIEQIMIFREMNNRSSLTANYLCESKKWDGIRPLSDLFEKEIKPQNEAIHFDQEFINYLKENDESIEKMHWRNFERLIAEFFNKIGYTVSLGPGTNDGGIDIRVHNSEMKESGPPLIIVQCKRYSSGNTVEISTVKAFYSDLLFEGAERGLIATTSRVARGGHSVISARNYNIDIAESQEVIEMIDSMWVKHFFA